MLQVILVLTSIFLIYVLQYFLNIIFNCNLFAQSCLSILVIISLIIQFELMESTQTGQVKDQVKTKMEQKQKLTLRGFKSLNRKSMFSPNNFAPIHINQINNLRSEQTANSNTSFNSITHQQKLQNQLTTNNHCSNNKTLMVGNQPVNIHNKQNIKDNMNKNQTITEQDTNRGTRKPIFSVDNVIEPLIENKNKMENKNIGNQANTIIQPTGFHHLQGRITNGFRNRSSSKNKGNQCQTDPEKRQQKQGKRAQEKSGKKKEVENSPVNVFSEFKQFGNLNKSNANKVITSNSKPDGEQITNRGSSKSSYVTGSPNVSVFKSPLKIQSINAGQKNILCEAISKDGQYKIISRNLAAQQLKQASQLEYYINLKSKKQSMKQLQNQQNSINAQNGNFQTSHTRSNSNLISDCNSPKKYTLDPSKISSKENGNIKAYAVNSNQGISRKYNEDRVSIILNIVKNGVKASYFAIYDGHGGANCCDFLTQNLHQLIFNSKYFPCYPRQAIIEGMREAETKFIQQVKSKYVQKKQLDRSGSCAIILLMVGDDCYIANLGDSRAVLSTCHGKPMYSLSRDHKPTDSSQQLRIMKEGGKIYRTQMTKIRKQLTLENYKEEQIRIGKREQKQGQNQTIIGPMRVYPGKLSVTRTFGDIEAKDPDLGGIRNCISSEPEICKYTLTGKEDFILLGCDGLFEKLDSEEAIEEAWKNIRKNRKSSIHEAVGAAAQSVVKLCMDRKGTDNITAIVVCLGSLGLETSLTDYASV